MTYEISDWTKSFFAAPPTLIYFSDMSSLTNCFLPFYTKHFFLATDHSFTNVTLIQSLSLWLLYLTIFTTCNVKNKVWYYTIQVSIITNTKSSDKTPVFIDIFWN
jgi:hypothetical protein